LVGPSGCRRRRASSSRGHEPSPVPVARCLAMPLRLPM
jgi:hypothetical protein